MKAKLIKTEFGFRVDDLKGILIGSTLPSSKTKISIKNCQAIERGYDLDELAKEANGYLYYDSKKENKALAFDDGYRVGFQKALEILGDKKFSEEDMSKAWSEGYHRKVDEINGNELRYFDKFIQSLQQTEWDVFVEMEKVYDGLDEMAQPQYAKQPKLDADECLILKRI